MPREFIFRNFGWKLLSLALAIIIWLTVKTTSSEQVQTEKTFLRQSLQIVSGTADVRTYRVEPAVVNITVKGSPSAIGRLQEPQIHALVDVTAADANHPFRRPVEVVLPTGLAVVRVEPSEVQIIPPPKPEPKIIITAPLTNP